MSADASSMYAAPQRECDLVMKGGVTSGLVYPQAVLELARDTPGRPGYRFRSIGGASAGAVAAIFAAAAEYNRPQGFVELEKVNSQLQSSDGTTSFLQRLFQAKPSMQPLLNIVVRLDEYQACAQSKGLLMTLWRVLSDNAIPGLAAGAIAGAAAGATLGLLLSGLISLLAAAPVFGPASLVLVTLFALTGAAIGWLYRGSAKLAALLTTELPKNYFGICSGMKETPNATAAATEWMHESTQKIAGRTAVLTFGELRTRNVALELMTTNVSEGRPYAFPFDDPFLFNKDDFGKLFPAGVVEAMVIGGEKRNRAQFPGVELPAAFCFMPARDDLPLIVAARMSMSFPLFFSSVPLYAMPLGIREQLDSDPGFKYAPKHDDLIPHWFSDGGIASNFPIHFFDAWLPRHPTFGITLRYLPSFLFGRDRTPEERLAAEHYRQSMGIAADAKMRPLGRRLAAVMSDESPRARASDEHVVVLPRAQDSVPPEWSYIATPRAENPGAGAVPNFLWAVIGSMQNYRDNLQAALPSYRERVAQVRLKPNEGGFNLDMDEALISRIVAKGRLAGEKLDTEFVDKHHKWVRLLVLVSELEQGFRRIREKKTDEEFAKLVDEQCASEGFPYREKESEVCVALRARLAALSAAMEAWASAPARKPFEGGSPPPVMRVTPKV